MFTLTKGAEDYEVFNPWFDNYLNGEVESFDLK